MTVLIDRIWRRRPRTAYRPQAQTTECGVSVLCAILADLGCDVPMRDVRLATGVSRDCVTASDIRRAARSFGVVCRARSCEVEELLRLRAPYVVHLRFIHFVVLERITSDWVEFTCPAQGRVRVPRSMFDDEFTGIVLEFERGPGFKSRVLGATPRILPDLWPMAAAAAAFAFAGSLAGMIWGEALTRLSDGALAPAALMQGFLVLAVAQLACVAVGRTAAAGTADRLAVRLQGKLPRMPDEFWVYRLPDVLVRRFTDIRLLPQAMTDRLGGAVEGLAAACSLSIVLGHRGDIFPLAFHLGVLAALIALAVLIVIGRRKERFWLGSAPQITIMMAEALRSSPMQRFGGQHLAARRLFRSRIAQGVMADMQLAWLRSAFFVTPIILWVGLPSFVLSFGSVFDADVIVTSLLAMIAFAGFLLPLTRVRGAWESATRAVALLDDLLVEPDTEQGRRDLAEADRSAPLALTDVSYSYSAGKRLHLQSASLTVSPGEQIGLTGPSGGGKSTLAAIASGLLKPCSGAVRVGGGAIEDWSPEARSRLIQYVGRRRFIVSATVRENILLGDAEITEQDLRAAVTDACLDEVLAEKALSLETKVGEAQLQFSGGQWARVEIARALARNPRYLILDDALDAVDVQTEMRIRTAARRRGLGLLVITQRRASLDACARVLYCREGRLTDEQPAHLAPDLEPSRANAAAQPAISLLGADRATRLTEVFAFVTGETPRLDLESLESMSPVQGLRALASAQRRDPRVVKLGGCESLRADGTALLALDPETGAAFAATWQSGRPAYRTADGRSADLAATGDERLMLFDLMAPADNAPASLRDWHATLRSSHATETRRMTALGGAVAILIALLPIAAATSAGPQRAIADSVLCAGVLLLLIGWRQLHGRVCALFAYSAGPQLAALAARPSCEALDCLPRRRLAKMGSGLAIYVERYVQHRSVLSFALPLAACALLFLLWASAPVTGLSVLALAALPVAASHLAAHRADSRSDTREDAAFQLERRLFAVLSGVRTVRSLGVLERLLRSCNASRTSLQSLEQRDRWAAATIGVFGRFVPVLAAGIVLITANRDQAPLAIVSATVLAFAVGLLQPLAVDLADRRSSLAADAFFALPRDVGREQVARHVDIQATGLGFRYGADSIDAFKGVDLSIGAGRMTVFAGASGSGKSTLLRVMLGLQTPSSGKIEINGISLQDADPVWRSNVAVILQGDALKETATIRSQLVLGRTIELAEIWRALSLVEMDAEVRAMPMGLQTIADSHSLSAGQTQRLLLARAILGGVTMIALDEAIDGIPLAQQIRILTRLRAVNFGLVVVTHRFEGMVMADEVCILTKGEPPRRMPGADLRQTVDVVSTISLENRQ